jgi:hypothetical protein
MQYINIISQYSTHDVFTLVTYTHCSLVRIVLAQYVLISYWHMNTNIMLKI